MRKTVSFENVLAENALLEKIDGGLRVKIEKGDDAPLSNLRLYKCNRSEYEHLINGGDVG